MKEKIYKLKEVFHSEFENPVNGEPYDSHEGGYLNKGSFVDTEDAVYEVFKDKGISDEDLEELRNELNKESPSWKRKEKA